MTLPPFKLARRYTPFALYPSPTDGSRDGPGRCSPSYAAQRDVSPSFVVGVAGVSSGGHPGSPLKTALPQPKLPSSRLLIKAGTRDGHYVPSSPELHVYT